MSGPTYNFSFQPPKMDAGNETPRSLRQHAAEIARALRQFPEIVEAFNALSARVTALEPATALAYFLLEAGTDRLLLEDGTSLLAME